MKNPIEMSVESLVAIRDALNNEIGVLTRLAHAQKERDRGDKIKPALREIMMDRGFLPRSVAVDTLMRRYPEACRDRSRDSINNQISTYVCDGQQKENRRWWELDQLKLHGENHLVFFEGRE